MTLDQLSALSIGDAVRLREKTGKVTRCTPTWFMVTWANDDVEIIRRRPSILTERLTLEPTT